MKKVAIIVIVLILVVAGIFALKTFTGNSIKEDEVKEFQVKAFRFGYSPDVIAVNKGDNAKIIIENTDTLHGMRIPELEISGNEIIEFTADKTGEFEWYCNNICGKGHTQMGGKLIVK